MWNLHNVCEKRPAVCNYFKCALPAANLFSWFNLIICYQNMRTSHIKTCPFGNYNNKQIFLVFVRILSTSFFINFVVSKSVSSLNHKEIFNKNTHWLQICLFKKFINLCDCLCPYCYVVDIVVFKNDKEIQQE